MKYEVKDRTTCLDLSDSTGESVSDGIPPGTRTEVEHEFHLLFSLDLGGVIPPLEIESHPPSRLSLHPSIERSPWHRRMGWRSALAQMAGDREWVLNAARDVFGPGGEPDWWVLEVFEKALVEAPLDELDAWWKLLDGHLRLPQGGTELGPTVSTQVLAWRFLEILEARRPTGRLFSLALEMLPVETRPPVWEAICRYCWLQRAESGSQFVPRLVKRLDPLVESSAVIRETGWLTLISTRGAALDTSAWEPLVREMVHRAIPLERDPSALRALLQYAVVSGLLGQSAVWDTLRQRVDPEHEPDWQIRETIWEVLAEHGENLGSSVSFLAWQVLDRQMESHPAVLRHLRGYGILFPF